MAASDNRNYGTLEPEYYQESLGPLTVQGRKYALVTELTGKLNSVQNELKECKKQQKTLQAKGKDLNEKDMERMKRCEEIVANLKAVINTEVTRFNLKIK